MKNTEAAGGTRFSAGKAMACYAPWGGMEAVCRVSEAGSGKYAPFDWLDGGQSFSTLLNSASRHLRKAMREPLAPDEESGHPHVAHAAWNLLALLDFAEQGRAPELDDVTPWRGVVTADARAIRKEAEERGVHPVVVLRERQQGVQAKQCKCVPPVECPACVRKNQIPIFDQEG